jgi:hypothetical protein
MTNTSACAHPTEMIPTLEELVAGITAEHCYDEIATGPERAREMVEWEPSAVS